MELDSAKQLKILIVEDDMVNSKLLEGMLSKSPLPISEVRAVKSLKATLEFLDNNDIDVVLLDLNLPDSIGLDTLIRVSKYPDITIVVITGEYDDKLGLEAINNGATEFLVKGRYDEYMLSKSICYAIERKRLELEQKQLLEKVNSINQELKSFAYIVSHDLKTPLDGIRTLAEWISTDYADKLGEDGTKQVRLLMARTKRMHDLIDGILQYSRIGHVKEEHVHVDLNELISEIIDSIVVPENIEIEIENELPAILCEQTRIIQVFQNLISNAVKYINKPEGKIGISCTEEDGLLKFSVSDNGPGIEEKHFERIFQIFQTVSKSDSYKSTGVGLTVVKKIVEMYGGKIWIESEFGNGCTFFFTLPKEKFEAVTVPVE